MIFDFGYAILVSSIERSSCSSGSSFSLDSSKVKETRKSPKPYISRALGLCLSCSSHVSCTEIRTNIRPNFLFVRSLYRTFVNPIFVIIRICSLNGRFFARKNPLMTRLMTRKSTESDQRPCHKDLIYSVFAVKRSLRIFFVFACPLLMTVL